MDTWQNHNFLCHNWSAFPVCSNPLEWSVASKTKGNKLVLAEPSTFLHICSQAHHCPNFPTLPSLTQFSQDYRFTSTKNFFTSHKLLYPSGEFDYSAIEKILAFFEVLPLLSFLFTSRWGQVNSLWTLLTFENQTTRFVLRYLPNTRIEKAPLAKLYCSSLLSLTSHHTIYSVILLSFPCIILTVMVNKSCMIKLFTYHISKHEVEKLMGQGVTWATEFCHYVPTGACDNAGLAILFPV